jgi:hypothetical protein
MKKLLLLLALLIGYSQALGAQDLTEGQRNALGEAQTWLEILDSGEFSESYHRTSPFWQAQTTEAAWASRLGAIFLDAGERASRTLLAVQEPQVVSPGMPAGRYAVVSFQSAYRNLTPALETVVLVSDPDDQWLVINYALQPWPAGPNSRPPPH